ALALRHAQYLRGVDVGGIHRWVGTHESQVELAHGAHARRVCAEPVAYVIAHRHGGRADPGCAIAHAPVGYAGHVHMMSPSLRLPEHGDARTLADLDRTDRIHNHDHIRRHDVTLTFAQNPRWCGRSSILEYTRIAVPKESFRGDSLDRRRHPLRYSSLCTAIGRRA